MKDLKKFIGNMWMDESVTPIEVERDGIPLGYSYPIIYSDGTTGIYNHITNNFLFNREGMCVKNGELSWTYFPCKSNMENWVQMIENHKL